jgi:hypothetical protein
MVGGNRKQNIVSQCSKMKTGNTGSVVIFIYSFIEREISQVSSAISDLMAYPLRIGQHLPAPTFDVLYPWQGERNQLTTT